MGRIRRVFVEQAQRPGAVHGHRHGIDIHPANHTSRQPLVCQQVALDQPFHCHHNAPGRMGEGGQFAPASDEHIALGVTQDRVERRHIGRQCGE